MIQAKIVLELPADLMDTVRLEEQWENEGGAASGNGILTWIPEHKIPFSPGDSFRVISGDIEIVNGQFYYSVLLEPVHGRGQKKPVISERYP